SLVNVYSHVSRTASKQTLIDNGRKPGSIGFAVQSDAHQCHRHDKAEAVREAPGENVILCRHQKTGAGEDARGTDECLEILIAFADRVGEKGDPGCVSGDPTEMFYDSGSAGGDRVAQLITAIEAVHGMTDAGLEVRHSSTPDGIVRLTSVE